MSKILIVDDSPVNLKLARMSLQSAGFGTLEAESGFDALKLAIRHKPALIFLDINMPDMDGVAVMEKMRETPAIADIPLVALTASAMKGDREKFLDKGFDDYISKPLSIEGLVETAKKYCTP